MRGWTVRASQPWYSRPGSRPVRSTGSLSGHRLPRSRPACLTIAQDWDGAIRTAEFSMSNGCWRTLARCSIDSTSLDPSCWSATHMEGSSSGSLRSGIRAALPAWSWLIRCWRAAGPILTLSSCVSNAEPSESPVGVSGLRGLEWCGWQPRRYWCVPWSSADVRTMVSSAACRPSSSNFRPTRSRSSDRTGADRRTFAR